MREENRPDPEELLQRLKREEARTRRGRLKIFLGMAAGVGKTCAMLRSASRRLEEGRDLVAGFIETHGREETRRLLDGIPVIPRKKVEYRGVTLEEMDLDAILERKPAIVLVDELAHSNVPGSRHARRWQDVIELIEAGIEVWTAVNVQHIESRAHTAGQIAGTEIRETIPDSLLDQADEVELIDLSPADLIERLKDGKIYELPRAQRALEHFFQPETLTALRELSLRLTAEHVDQDLRERMREKRIVGPWKTNERLLVAVSAAPTSADLIRWTRRQAYILGSPWTAVYVETSRRPGEKEHKKVMEHLDLARELGAEIVTTHDESVADGILRVSRECNVSQIVVGRTASNPLLDLLRGGSITGRILKNSGSVDVHVVAGESNGQTTPSLRTRVLPEGLVSNRSQYIVSLIAVSLTMGVGFLLEPFAGYRSVSIFFVLTVLLLALIVGRGPVVLAAAASALAWNFFFIPPRYTFYVSKPEDALMLFSIFAVAAVTGVLTSRVRSRENLVRRREALTTSLYRLARDLAALDRSAALARATRDHLEQSLPVHCSIRVRTEHGLLGSPALAGEDDGDEKERAVARWCFENRRPAGRFTDTLPLSKCHYLPLLASGQVVGVLQLNFLTGDRPPDPETRMLLDAVASQLASALLRVEGAKRAGELRLTAESDRLYRNVLSSVSHELRTPIAAMKGAASTLLDSPRITAEQRDELLREILLSSDRLNGLVEDLLDMQRIESGHLRPRLEWCDAADLIERAVSDRKSVLAGRGVEIHVKSPSPLVHVDAVLMIQALGNLLANAARHSLPGHPIHIGFAMDAGAALFFVEDEGPGIPVEERDRIFQKFYRSPSSGPGGAGLGLSIVRGFVEAHGGSVAVRDRAGGGSRFELRFPEEAMHAAEDPDHR